MTSTCFIQPAPEFSVYPAAHLGGPQLVGVHRNARLSTHDLHQDPDTSIRRDLFNLGYKVGKWPLGQRHLITGIQELWRQQFSRRVTAQHELCDQIQWDRRRLLAETYKPRDAVGRVYVAPKSTCHVKGHENVAGEQWPHGRNELAIALACFVFQRQEGFEALTREALIRDVGAVRLQLRQKPARPSIVKRHHAPPIAIERVPSRSARGKYSFVRRGIKSNFGCQYLYKPLYSLCSFPFVT